MYPSDYHAELTQFERNYPYREFKISNFIRKMNHRNDKYPVFMGQMDSGDIDDDQEEYMATVWNEMLLQREPLDTNKFPSLPGLNQEMLRVKDVFVPNANSILFKIFSSLPPVSIHLTPENSDEVREVFDYVFEFGGFPMVEIGNLLQIGNIKASDLQFYQRA